jgi:hypothetical protein
VRTLTSLKVALAAVGLVVWGYGVRVDDPVLRWVGIALFAGAVLMRFLSRRRPPGV